MAKPERIYLDKRATVNGKIMHKGLPLDNFVEINTASEINVLVGGSNNNFTGDNLQEVINEISAEIKDYDFILNGSSWISTGENSSKKVGDIEWEFTRHPDLEEKKKSNKVIALFVIVLLCSSI